MRRLSDDIINHLRHVCDFPDVGATKYRLIRELSRGSPGTVYEADDSTLGRRIALNVIHMGEVYDRTTADALAKLEDEARMLARLDHPGIAPIHDVGRLSNGRLFFTTRILNGYRLDEYRRTPASFSDRLRVFQKICDTVAYIHSQGIVHRSLVPQNVMVGKFGEVIITDWRHAQFHGDNVRKVVAGDVQALGTILGFLIETPPKRIKAICDRAVAAERTQRYASVGQLMDEIAAFLDGRPIVAYREGVLERASRWISRTTTRPPYPT